MDESMKNAVAMILGAITSIGASVTGFIDGYSFTLLTSVPIMSWEFLGSIITAFILGASGALGGMIIRDAYKAIFKGLTKEKNNEL